MNPTRKRQFKLIGAVVGVVALIAIVIFYFEYRNIISTDDAFVDGRIVQISSKVAGQIVNVAVDDNQPVKKGDTLVEIDPVPFQVALDEERAKLAAAEVEAKRSSADAARYDEIFKKDEISKQQLDNAQAAATAARAAVERERAAVERAQLNVSYAKITAPETGRVTRKSAEPGMYVQVGQALLSIVPSEVWVTANFKETQLTDIHPGLPATLKVDAYPDQPLRGHVDSIQLGTGARFSLFPPENATGNFVKVVQRVPVKIVIDADETNKPLLAPGMSVEASVKLR
jgi:membrane fusion protein (multidrug efflux system)